jgi:hypothetical protein
MDKEFAVVLRDSLLMIIRYLEKRFSLGPHAKAQGQENNEVSV